MMRSTIGMALFALAVTGCGETVQTATGGKKKPDSKAWESSQNTYAAEGWKGGDQAAWEAQMRLRAQGQNEYARSAAVAAPTKTP